MKGNLHEQIATEAVYKKESIDSWWVKQKYNDSGNETKQTPYKYFGAECHAQLHL